MNLLKYICSLLLITMGCLVAYGQLTKTRAEQYKKKYAYSLAIEFYEAHLDKNYTDYEAMLDLAECYYRIKEMDKTIEWYRRSIDTKGINKVHYLNYADALSQNRDYEESKTWYEKYRSIAGSSELCRRKIEGLQHINDFYKDSTRYVIDAFPHNSEYIDFAPCFYGYGFIFASSRPTSKNAVKHNSSWTGGDFFDLYRYHNNDEYIVPFDPIINSPFHEGKATFNKDETKIFFTRNNYYHAHKRKDHGVSRVQIFTAELGQHGWGKLKEFQFDDKKYSVGDPYYVEEDSVMFFSSDMPGGFGGSDIYMIIYMDGMWTKPINLGNQINTQGNERSPFYTKEGDFYFSSDGHAGLGGMDIYRTQLEISVNMHTDIENMGYPLNSSYDDFGLILNNLQNRGYFASNRPGGMGMDDIYKVTIIDIPRKRVVGNVKVRNKQELLPGDQAFVQVQNITDGITEDYVVTNASGKFEIELVPGRKYQFIVKKGTYEEGRGTIFLDERGHYEPLNITLGASDTMVAH